MAGEYKMSMPVKESWQRRQKMLEKVEDPELKGGQKPCRRVEKPGSRAGVRLENKRKVPLAFSLSSAYTVRGSI